MSSEIGGLGSAGAAFLEGCLIGKLQGRVGGQHSARQLPSEVQN